MSEEKVKRPARRSLSLSPAKRFARFCADKVEERNITRILPSSKNTLRKKAR